MSLFSAVSSSFMWSVNSQLGGKEGESLQVVVGKADGDSCDVSYV